MASSPLNRRWSAYGEESDGLGRRGSALTSSPGTFMETLRSMTHLTETAQRDGGPALPAGVVDRVS